MNLRIGLSDTTWTCGLYHPKVARYQLRHTQIFSRRLLPTLVLYHIDSTKSRGFFKFFKIFFVFCSFLFSCWILFSRLGVSIYKLPKNMPFFDHFFLPPVIFDENLTKKMSKLILYKSASMWYNTQAGISWWAKTRFPQHKHNRLFVLREVSILWYPKSQSDHRLCSYFLFFLFRLIGIQISPRPPYKCHSLLLLHSPPSRRFFLSEGQKGNGYGRKNQHFI